MSDHLASHTEITFVPEHSKSTKGIWKVFWVLLVITVVEVSIGLFMYSFDMPSGVIVFLKGIIIILGLAKAFYIIAYFMHLNDELKNLMMTMVLPFIFLLWGILALIIDGETILDNKNNFDAYYKQKTEKIEKQPATKHLKGTGEGQH